MSVDFGIALWVSIGWPFKDLKLSINSKSFIFILKSSLIWSLRFVYNSSVIHSGLTKYSRVLVVKTSCHMEHTPK